MKMISSDAAVIEEEPPARCGDAGAVSGSILGGKKTNDLKVVDQDDQIIFESAAIRFRDYR